MTIAKLIQEFDRLYQEQAPLRYATIRCRWSEEVWAS